MIDPLFKPQSEIRSLSWFLG